LFVGQTNQPPNLVLEITPSVFSETLRCSWGEAASVAQYSKNHQCLSYYWMQQRAGQQFLSGRK
jgi:hypothetical protein